MENENERNAKSKFVKWYLKDEKKLLDEIEMGGLARPRIVFDFYRLEKTEKELPEIS